MRKEVLIAIFIGILLGSAIAFGISRVNSYLSPKKDSAVASEQKPEEAQNIDTSQLIITQPEDNSVSSKDKITIKGSASPNSTVVIVSNLSEAVTQAKNDGSFEQEIGLDGGPNQITILAYDSQGNESKQIVTVVYSTEFGEE